MTGQNHVKWAELATQAQKGDKVAYGKLLREIAPYIKNVLVPSLANPNWADDITQEVLLSVHKALYTYAADRPFRPWLNSIINYRKLDFLRGHYTRRGDKSVDLEKGVNLESDVTAPEDIAELGNIDSELAKFPEPQRQIFEMIKIQGYSAQEVAEKMDMSVSAVKVSAHRTLAKLKENLG